jgi:RNA polymerase sigma-70 factor (ECF subfamily)
VTSSDEEKLIQRAQGGDTEAFCQLARTYSRRLHTLALHYCRDAHDAEDLSQEVWLKAFKALKTFRGESTFYTWLRRIVINTFLNHQRGPRLRLVHPSRDENDAEIDPLDLVEAYVGNDSFDIETSIDKKILVERIAAALQELTPQQRLIFLLKHSEGLTYAEVADTVGCSVGTVKKSLFRAIGKVRNCLGVESEAARLEAYAAGEN